MKIKNPIAPGFRRPFTIIPDHPVDIQTSGQFFDSEIVSGDSSPPKYNTESTATSLKGWLYGDGATGDKSVRISADGHVGDGDQEITLDIDYSVNTPDATSLESVTFGTDEAIPA